MYKLDLEMAEEPEIKLPASAGSQKKEGNSRKTSDYAKVFDCKDHKNLWKTLKKMGISDHLTCLLRNLYAGQEATVIAGCGTMDWFKTGKGVHQGCMLSPCLYYIQNTSCEMSDWMKYKLESSLLGEISVTLDMQMTPPLQQRVKRN